ncbi:MAG: DEAD/DEAH box helicase [Candidatus Gracilibacteria bacterium]|nr:DEAD/DEAH box helicase [Candidatus Gracilibacteria bacterium]
MQNPEIIALKSGTSYTNIGNIFSKSLIINNSFDFNNRGVILFCDNNKNLKNYQKFFNFHNIKPVLISSEAEIFNIKNNLPNLYLVDVNIFYSKNNAYYIENNAIKLEKNQNYNIDEIIKRLADFGYQANDFLEPGSYNKKGDIINIMPFGQDKYSYNISFWGETLEEITLLNNFENTSEKIEKVELGEDKRFIIPEDINTINRHKFNSGLFDLFKSFNNTEIILDNLDLFSDLDKLDFENKISLDLFSHPEKTQTNLDITDLYIKNIEDFRELLNSTNKVNIYTKNIKNIENFLDYNKISGINLVESNLNFLKSFRWENNYFIADDNLNRIFVKKRVKKSVSDAMDLLLTIREEDYVVHIDHGIGIYKGIIKKKLINIEKEYLQINYENDEKLFVPIEQTSRISKYVGADNPKLTPLHKQKWQRDIAKATKDAKEYAQELMKIYSERKASSGFSFVLDKEKIQNFQDSFPYIYTGDQSAAINEILGDMAKDKPMDRLLSGDVGFGKTEVAFNAIYNAITNKKQAVLVSPLVILAYEHYESAIERFREFGFKIEILTRFQTQSRTKTILERLKKGDLDLVVGTHRLLSDKIIYKDLGLLVVDEEHKFGVKDKEKIKAMKTNIDVLSMSATPIPRSLNMALASVRELSVLKTPPIGRQSISTIVSDFNEKIVVEACKREFKRGGQIFFVHNRITGIERLEKKLQELFPKKKIIITHSRLPGEELEDRILAFKRKEYDILLTTTVIENGVDFENVNTIFINDAYKMGLAQIHQLRGRVGRRSEKGYCYLLYDKKKLKEDGANRLRTLVDYSYLGAGFELAMKDLEVRGGGDILGLKQSGHTSQIGVSTYIKILEQEVAILKEKMGETDKNKGHKINTIVDINISAFLDDNFFSSEMDKIHFYREIQTINNLPDLENIISDLQELNNNELNIEAKNFFDLLKIRILADKYGIENIRSKGIHYEINFSNKNNKSLENIRSFLDLDKKVYFSVFDATKIRTKKNNFKGERDFLDFLLNIFSGKTKVKPKIRKKIIK